MVRSRMKEVNVIQDMAIPICLILAPMLIGRSEEIPGFHSIKL